MAIAREVYPVQQDVMFDLVPPIEVCIFQSALCDVKGGVLIDLLIVYGCRETNQQFITVVIERFPWVFVTERNAGFADVLIALPIDIHAHIDFCFALLEPDGLRKGMVADNAIDCHMKHQRPLLHYAYAGGLVGTGYESRLLAEVAFEFIEMP